MIAAHSIDNPLVSVLIPVYNTEEFIHDCINSVINQTYYNIEILICNDGSNDHSYEILKKDFDDNRITLSTNTQNMGKVYTINKLLDQAKGEYISFLDSDDLYDPHKIEYQLNFLRKNRSYGLVGSSYYRIDEYGAVTSEYILDYDHEEIVDSILNFNGSRVLCGSVMCKRKLALSVGGYRKYFDKINGEDLDFVARILNVAKGKSLEIKLYYYRYRSNSLTRRVYFTGSERHSLEIVAFLFRQRLVNNGKDSLNSEIFGLQDFENELNAIYKKNPKLLHRKISFDLALNKNYIRSLKYLLKGLSIIEIKKSLIALLFVFAVILVPNQILLYLKNKRGIENISRSL